MISRVERDARINRGEVREVRGTPGWERTRVQVGSFAIDTVSPKGIAKAFEVKETIDREQERHRNCGGKGKRDQDLRGGERIVGHMEDGEGVSLRIQRADVKKVLQDEHGRQRSFSGRREDLHAEQGDEREDKDEL